jgi:transposase-like protein
MSEQRSYRRKNGDKSLGRKPRRIMSAEKKYQIFLEALRTDRPIAELLRREGIYATDLNRIREKVREGALERLRDRPGGKKSPVAAEEYEALKRELEAKERALADLSVELAMLRKKTNGGSWDR